MLTYYHRHIYFSGLLLVVVSLPLSMFLLSVAQFILVINWILENNFREKWEVFKNRKSILSFCLIYLVHLIGMLYSNDWQYGIHDLKIKLPLLLLPVILGTTKSISFKQFNTVLLTFAGAVFLSTLISVGKLYGIFGAPIMDVRDISIFISHIRLALMVNMALFILIPMINKSESFTLKSALLLLLLWFVIFLIILKSLTGVVIFIVLALYFCLRWVLKNQNLIARWFIVVGSASVLLVIMAYATNSIAHFYYIEKVDFTTLEEATVNGNKYFHDLGSKDFENGNYTWLYVCDKELEPAWNKRSMLNFKGVDLKGQELRYTLIRYLTSKGLRKDSIGINSLTNGDIKNIERGMANYIYSWKFSFYPRIYQLLWEIYQYKNGGNPSGHSFTQRLEYLKSASHIIKSNFFIGVGTGDVANAFEEQYKNDKSKLDLRWRLRAHNQFFTFFITFGVIGFFIITLALIYPSFKEKKWNNYYLILFLIIGFISFMNEDTMETHAGISFLSFFYAFFLYNTILKDANSQ